MTESPIAMNGSKRRRVLPALVIALVAIVAVLAIAGGVWLALRSSGSDGRGTSSAARVDPTLESARDAYETGDFAAAESELSAVVAGDSGDIEARKALALALSAQGRNDEALEQYAAVVEADPNDHASLYQMAVLERLLGRTDEAIAHFELAYAVQSDVVYADELARTYVQAGRYEEAVTAWQAVIDSGTLDEGAMAGVYAAMASAHEGMRDYAQARSALSSALALTPNDTVLKERLEGLGTD